VACFLRLALHRGNHRKRFKSIPFSMKRPLVRLGVVRKCWRRFRKGVFCGQPCIHRACGVGGRSSISWIIDPVRPVSSRATREVFASSNGFSRTLCTVRKRRFSGGVVSLVEHISQVQDDKQTHSRELRWWWWWRRRARCDGISGRRRGGGNAGRRGTGRPRKKIEARRIVD
jgi:hypothetical protein